MIRIIANEQTPKAEDVNLETDLELINEVVDYVKTLKGKAIAMACNQLEKDDIRINKNFFVSLAYDEPKVFINPKILSYSGTIRQTLEKCMTWGDKEIVATRHSNIKLEFTDIDGQRLVIDTSNTNIYEGQIFQHEIAHLIGDEFKFEFIKEQSRNESCNCGSGKKYKKCCGGI